MVLYKPDLNNRIPDDVLGIASALTELDGSEMDLTENVHGTCIRWGNGLQVCFATQTLAYEAGTVLVYEWTFPLAFVANNIIISVSGDGIGLAAAKREGILGARAKSTASARIELRAAAVFEAGDTIEVDVIAVGKWK